MSTITEKLKWLVEADATSAIKGFDAAGKAADKNLTLAEKKSQKLGGTLTKVGAGAMAASGIIGGALFKAAGAFEDLAISAGKMADATGLSVDEASRWIEVAGDMGVGTDTIESALGKMNKTLGATPEKFKALGIEIAATKNGTEDVNGTFINTIERLNEIKDPAERAAAAASIFGKGWQGAAELLKLSTGDIKTQLQSVSDQKVINEEELGKAKDYRASLDDLKDSAEDLAIGIGQGAAPVIGALASGIAGVASAFGSLNAVTGGAAGEFLAIGTIGLGLIGTLSLVAGQAIKLRDRFTVVGVDGSRSLNKVGKAAKGVGIAVGAIGAALVVYELAQAAARHEAEEFANELEAINRATDDQAMRKFAADIDVLTQASIVGNAAGKAGVDVIKDMIAVSPAAVVKIRDLAASHADFAAQLAASGITVDDMTTAIDEEAAAQGRAAEATDKGEVALADYKDTTDDTSLAGLALKLAQEQVKGSIDATKKAVDDAAKATEEYKRKSDEWASSVAADTDEVMGKWDELTGKISDDNTWLDLQTSFDNVKVKVQEAWQATADGAEDAEQKTRDAQHAVNDITLETMAYAAQVLKIPPEKLTKVQALIDQGAFDEAEELLRILTRDRGVGIFANVDPRRSSGPDIYATAEGGIVKASPGGTLLQAGEAGYDEAVIPLDGKHGLPGSSGGGTTYNYTINMPVGTSPDEMMRTIEKWRERNGNAKWMSGVGGVSGGTP